MKWIFMTVTALTLCASGLCSAAPETLRITGFRQGLIQFDSQGEPRIYKSGNDFPYQVNGTCVAAGKEYPCMWHGFEFSFTSPEDVSRLNCTSEASQPRKEVKPDKVIASNVAVVNWGFTLNGRKGHYVRPQYTFDVKKGPFRDATRCTYKGQEVLKFEFGMQTAP